MKDKTCPFRSGHPCDPQCAILLARFVNNYGTGHQDEEQYCGHIGVIEDDVPTEEMDKTRRRLEMRKRRLVSQAPRVDPCWLNP